MRHSTCDMCGTRRYKPNNRLQGATLSAIRAIGAESLPEECRVCIRCAQKCRTALSFKGFVRLQITKRQGKGICAISKNIVEVVRQDVAGSQLVSSRCKSTGNIESLAIAALRHIENDITNNNHSTALESESSRTDTVAIRRETTFPQKLQQRNGNIIPQDDINTIQTCGRVKRVAPGIIQVSDPFPCESMQVEDLIQEARLPKHVIVNTRMLLSLLEERICPNCNERKLNLLSKSTGMEGLTFRVGLKCPKCKKEFRVGRDFSERLNPMDGRSTTVLNVLYSIAVVLRGNSLTKMNSMCAFIGIGRGVSEQTAYKILGSCDLRKKIEYACKEDCIAALKVVLDGFCKQVERKMGTEEGQGMCLEELFEDTLLGLCFDGAWSHSRNASVGWGDLLACLAEEPEGYKTRFPVVAFHAVQKSRLAATGSDSVSARDGEVSGNQTGESSGDEHDGNGTKRYLFEGEHGDAASNLMEDRCFRACMDSIEQILVEKGVKVRLFMDGDLSIGARALMFSFITEIGLDLRHISSTFKKRLLVSRKDNTVAFRNLVDRIQLHFRWCYFVCVDQGLTEQQFDNMVVQCIAHWCDDHAKCHMQSLCQRSGRGLNYKVSKKVSLSAISAEGRSVLEKSIRKALHREKFQRIVVPEKSGVCESLHLSLSVHGSSNAKNCNDRENALLRKHLAILVWNRGYEFVIRLILKFLFGNREVLTVPDWENIAELDREVARDHKNQQEKEEKEKQKRRISSDEAARQMRPFDMSYNTELVPYGKFVEICNNAIANTTLTDLYCSISIRPRKRDSYRSRPKCTKCKLLLPRVRGLCLSCRTRTELLTQGFGFPSACVIRQNNGSSS